MKTMINIKADKEIKERAQGLARQLGLPLSAIINAYLRDFIYRQEVKFSLEPQIRPELEKFLEKVSKDYSRGKNIIGPFLDSRKMDIYLDA